MRAARRRIWSVDRVIIDVRLPSKKNRISASAALAPLWLWDFRVPTAAHSRSPLVRSARRAGVARQSRHIHWLASRSTTLLFKVHHRTSSISSPEFSIRPSPTSGRTAAFSGLFAVLPRTAHHRDQTPGESAAVPISMIFLEDMSVHAETGASAGASGRGDSCRGRRSTPPEEIGSPCRD